MKLTVVKFEDKEMAGGGGEVRDSLHETRPAVCCISQFGTQGKISTVVGMHQSILLFVLHISATLVGWLYRPDYVCGDPIASHQPG